MTTGKPGGAAGLTAGFLASHGSIWPTFLSEEKLHRLELEMAARAQSQVTQLRERTQQLEMLNQNLRGAVMERDFAQRELDKARLAAEAANRAKSDFLATMSHEIRTPMNGIIGMLELLKTDRLTARQRDSVHIARSSADALLRLLNDVLDLARIESGQLTLESIPFDLGAVVSQAADIVSHTAAGKGLDFIVRHAPDAPRYVYGDPVRLRQVVINLAGNAIKFTERGTVFIDVQAAETPEGGRVGVRIFVHDAGIGIPQEKLEHIFARFTQVDASTVRRFGGSGLGLAITRQLAELMGGTVTVTSEAGRGSTFIVHLPFVPDPAPGDEAEPDLPALRGSRVLIVDDNARARDLLRELLSGWGIRHDSCAGGEQGWRLLMAAERGRDPYHVAIVDSSLRNPSSEELLARIGQDAAVRETRVALVATWKEASDPRLVPAGVECIFQPIHPEALLRVLSRAHRLEPTLAAPPPSLVEPERPPEFHVRVLVVDDNATNQKVAASMLERLGCRVDVAENGLQALELLDRAPVSYSLILMDLEMPEMDGEGYPSDSPSSHILWLGPRGLSGAGARNDADLRRSGHGRVTSTGSGRGSHGDSPLDGYTATKEIHRRYEGWQQIPIVAMSANAFEEGRTRSQEAGLDDYLCKPIMLEDLQAVLERYMGQSVPLPDPSSEEIQLPADSVLDAATVQRLTQLAEASGARWFDELCDNFIVDTRERVRSLKQEAAAGNVTEMRALLHVLVGAGSSMGAQNLVEVCTQIQQRVHHGEDAAALVERLEPELERVRVELDRLKELAGA